MSGPDNPDRRNLLAAAAVGVAAAAGPAVFGGTSASAQSSDNAGSKHELSGKVAFITGGARGIGLASAVEMAKAGANIVLFDIATPNLVPISYRLSSEADLAAAQAQIEGLGVQCISYKGDVRNLADLQSAMRQAVDRFGRLDIVLANAGVGHAGAIDGVSAELFSTLYETNVGGYMKTTQAAVPHLRGAGGGRIIYVSSGLSRTGNDIFGVYGSTKWAVNGFAKSAALAYGRDNILCNVVAPGLVRTPFADNAAVLGQMMPNASNPTFDAVSEMIAQSNPIGVGHVEPEEVAKSVMYFTGEATDKMTGEVLDVGYGAAATSVA
ncbi:SDR family NAD(P)-dependent oxidoreductase [Erythrobacter ani]|uniref:SDR family NAD(P)-dependent oxidoreductase n=1 Tax=Erythrobacter ani TaxID=2827235 RepID=A0ABS6SM47_9SPHN|nr:SDR family NAD(P)-dependent oxidoreductase [Erythrobacter ani]MBV7266118.1 SDR family NAD(P)-dependent oxidoreductase [Erythrobacter ani]